MMNDYMPNYTEGYGDGGEATAEGYAGGGYANGGLFNTMKGYARKAAPYLGGALAVGLPAAAMALSGSRGGSNRGPSSPTLARTAWDGDSPYTRAGAGTSEYLAQGGEVDGYAGGGYADGGYTDGGYADEGYADGGAADGYADGGYLDTAKGYARRAAPYVGGTLAALAPLAAMAFAHSRSSSAPMGQPASQALPTLAHGAGTWDMDGSVPYMRAAAWDGEHLASGGLADGGWRSTLKKAAPYIGGLAALAPGFAAGAYMAGRPTMGTGRFQTGANLPLMRGYAGGGYAGGGMFGPMKNGLSKAAPYARKAAPYVGGTLAALAPLAVMAFMNSRGGRSMPSNSGYSPVSGDMRLPESAPRARGALARQSLYPVEEAMGLRDMSSPRHVPGAGSMGRRAMMAEPYFGGAGTPRFADGGLANPSFPLSSSDNIQARMSQLAANRGVPGGGMPNGMPNSNPYVQNSTVASPAQNGFPAYHHVGGGNMGAWIDNGQESSDAYNGYPMDGAV